MNQTKIPKLLAALARFPSSNTVFNPYQTVSRMENLRAYLKTLCSYPYSGHLFVGEAPGYKGCAVTGIPFSSERVLCSGSHPFLNTLLPLLTLNGNVTERSATIVWKQFEGKSSIPAFWNAFPFHPHSGNKTDDNRKPTSAEISVGKVYLQAVVDILEPHTIIAVGRVAAAVTASAFPHLQHRAFPHPSYQGTAGFIAGCASLKLI